MNAARICFLLLLLPTWAVAQTTTTYELLTYAKGATAPIQTFPFTTYACNLAAPTAPNAVNPARIWWVDDANAGRFCQYADPGTGPLLARPVGDYEATLRRVMGIEKSAESARVPFTKAALPTAPTGLLFSK